MKYNNIKKATFISRPNRFIAHIKINNNTELCHVKNTGRCKELLTEGAEIYVQEFDTTTRKTKYDLIAVKKGRLLINMDSQAPNKIFHEYLSEGKFFGHAAKIKPEYKYGNSRIDFYIEAEDKKMFAEIKGCTLEENGVIRFPDAPTERGLKHIFELIHAVENGFVAYIVFVVQMEKADYFTPNYQTHRAFGEALLEAEKAGVKIIAIKCHVKPDEISLDIPIPVRLKEEQAF